MALRETLINARLRDMLGSAISDPTSARLIVSNKKAFEHGTEIVPKFSKSQAFDSNGEVQLSVVETETPDVKVHFQITYLTNGSQETINLKPAVITDTIMLDLGTITSVDDYQI